MKCKIARCDESAIWTITVEGHPNSADSTHAYCGEHIQRQVPTWDESPKPYVVTVKGPFPTDKIPSF